MTPTDLLDLFERGTADIGKPNPVPGFARAYFDRVFDYFGADVGKAAHLASRWADCLPFADDRALIYRAKGLSEWLRGDWKAAAKSFEEAGRRQISDRWTYAIPAIDAKSRSGNIPEAIQFGRRLIRRLRGSPVQQARARINIGNAYEQADLIPKAKLEYRKALQQKSVVIYAIDWAKAELGLSTCLIATGDLEEAESLAESARQTFLTTGQAQFANLCQANMARIELARGRPDEALDLLIPLREEAQEARLPWLIELIGDVFLSLNLWPESLDCYSEALSYDSITAAGRANCFLGTALSLFGLGKVDDGTEALKRAIRAYRNQGNLPMEALAQFSLVTAFVDHSLPGTITESKLVRMSDTAKVLKNNGWDVLACRSRLLQLELKGRANQPVSSSEISGAVPRPLSKLPEIEWRRHYVMALSAPASEKKAHYRKMLEALLLARTKIRSVSSRVSYLADKQRAISDYLGLLLQSNRRSSTREAFSVLRQTRSIALIDEIAAGGSSFAPEVIDQLAQLRLELQDIGEGDMGSQRSRLVSSRRPTFSVSRRWREIGRWAIKPVSSDNGVQLAKAGNCVALTTSNDCIYALSGSGYKECLSLTLKKLKQSLSAFYFELLEPLVDADADPARSLAGLEELADHLDGSWWEMAENGISPGEDLWPVPWSALSQLKEKPEPILRLIPQESAMESLRMGDIRSVMIWAGNSKSLPNVDCEVDLIRTRYPGATVCYTREEALLKLNTGQFDLLHVAAHASHSRENPMFSLIRFSDGDIYANEIAKCGGRVKLATIATCDSGKLTTRHQQEPDGIVRAFLALGARTIVACAWPLDDEAGLRLAMGLYEDCLPNETLVSALRRTRKDLRRWTPHPFFWGAPTIFGGYGPKGPKLPINGEK